MNLRQSAAICAALLLAACGQGGTPTPTDITVAPMASPTAEPSVTAIPTPDPSAVTGFGFSDNLRVAVDTLAIVTLDGVNVRDAPSLVAPVQTIAPGAPTSGQPIQASAGDRVWVIAEERVDDEVWYQIAQDASFNAGWISGGPHEDPWLRPFDPGTCPESFSDALASGDPIPPFSMEHLVCFGGEQLGAVVYWLPPDDLNLPCPWPEAPNEWLICYEAVNVSGDSTPQLTVYGTVGRDDIVRGEWVTLLGHYDDPRSNECPQTLGRDMTDAGSVAATIISCRSAFVLDEVRPPVAP